MNTDTFASDQANDDSLRQAALVTLRKKRDFRAHMFVPMLGWGIGVFFNAWDVYSPEGPSEEQIQREMRRLNRR